MSAPGPDRRADSTRDTWETPDALYAKLDKQFGFTLDGAANETNHKHPLWLGPGSSLCEDAFAFFPERQVVFLNPPYGHLGQWAALCALWGQGASAATVVALLPANTDTKWFRRVFDTADEIRFLEGRVGFVHSPECACKACSEGKDGSNTGASMVCVWRKPWLKRLPYVWLWDWRDEGGPDADPNAGSPVAAAVVSASGLTKRTSADLLRDFAIAGA